MTFASTPRIGRMTLGERLVGMLDRAASSHARACLALVLVCLALFLPGYFGLPPVDRDEARFAQATKQMLETGDFVDIRFQDLRRHGLPPGVHWLQAGVVAAAEAVGIPNARTAIPLYRLPSILGAIAAVLLTYWAALAFASRRAAVLAGLMLATCLLLGVEARLAKADAVLLALVVAAMGALGRIWLIANDPAGPREVPRHLPAIFWTALAAGVLVEGSMILVVALSAIVALAITGRNGAWLMRLRPLAGLLWFVLLVAPWVLAGTLASDGGVFDEVAVPGFLGRLLQLDDDGALPLTYALAFWLTFWPAAPLFALAIPGIWAERNDPRVAVLLAWLVPAWIVLELVPSKGPHLVLPLYPAIAILTARAVDAGRLALDIKALRRTTLFWPIMALVLPLGALGAWFWLAGKLGFQTWPFIAGGAFLAVFAWRFFEDDGPERSFLMMVPACMLVALTVWALILPGVRPVWINERIAPRLADVRCEAPRLVAAGIREPSLVFLYGTNLVMTNGEGAAEFLAGPGCRAAIVAGRRVQDAFQRRADALGLRYRRVNQLSGYAINGGRRLQIVIFAVGEPET